ncbi:MAG: type II secretion system F family protein [Planctomycetia bacterium]|jgi:type IV pilus assembly protein PilC
MTNPDLMWLLRGMGRCLAYVLIPLFLITSLCLGFGGAGIYFILLSIAYIAWVIFAMLHYRHIRQEEIHFLLLAITNTGCSLVTGLEAFLAGQTYSFLGKNRKFINVVLGSCYFFLCASFLFFIASGEANHLLPITGLLALIVILFHGVSFLVTQKVQFNKRLGKVLEKIKSGETLEISLKANPGVVSPEVLLAISLGEPTGKLGLCLEKTPSWNQDFFWIHTLPRLAYAMAIILFTICISTFQTVFIVPKFQKIFQEFQAKMPVPSEWFFRFSNLLARFWFLLIPAVLFLIGLILLPILTPRVRWWFPLVGRIYRVHVQGNFLSMLGISMLTQEVMPWVLGFLKGSSYFPKPAMRQIDDLASRMEKGESFSASMRESGWVPSHMVPLMESAQRVGNLPWALSEAGTQRNRLAFVSSQRLTFTLFPILLLILGLVVGFIAVAMFLPLVELIVMLT